jgi:hypothetical protein
MKVRNVHQRELPLPASRVGLLIDTLSSADDALWPADRWPAMKFDRPLSVGAVGGHGPIGYVVEGYTPGSTVRFRFSRPRGFLGFHAFEVEAVSAERTRLRHVLEMEVSGRAALAWTLAYRPLHDALIEDALDRGMTFVGVSVEARRWSLWVLVLRRMLRRRRGDSQRSE